MTITIIGTGYVGLVTGIGFAEKGNTVICVDNNQDKLDLLKQGISPIWEKGLSELLAKNIQNQTISFSDDLAGSVKSSEIIFLCLPTPPKEDGSADLSHVVAVAKEMSTHLDEYKIIVNKSTVPVGSTDLIKTYLLEQNQNAKFDVVSNPEFLREGNAIEDFLNPERVVVGTSSNTAKAKMLELYKPFVADESQILLMDEKSSELTKYAANSFLATKITFINQIASLCELNGANVEMIAKGVGLDSRIGSKFLQAGIGYGGSCFPKDVSALIKYSDYIGYDFSILKSVQKENLIQKLKPVEKVTEIFGEDLSGLAISIWGLAFKPETDDIRESPSIYIIQELLQRKAKIKAFDPIAISNVQKFTDFEDKYSNQIEYLNDKYEATKDTDCLLICTDWQEFKDTDLEVLKSQMKQKYIFDGRNIFDKYKMLELGFDYYSIGR